MKLDKREEKSIDCIVNFITTYKGSCEELYPDLYYYCVANDIVKVLLHNYDYFRDFIFCFHKNILNLY